MPAVGPIPDASPSPTPPAFCARDRGAELAAAAEGTVDVLVIGAGATGAGVALDAASRGLSVLLVDKGDLASGTSSKSSKLVHGGLRYLENYEFGLVRESVVERQLLTRLAPHLVRPMDFVYPVFDDTERARLVGVGLTTYDVFAGLRNVRRHERVDRDEAIALAPALAGSDVRRAFVYGDCATDDARLVLAVTLAARAHGATVVTYAEVAQLRYAPDGAVAGAVVRDRLDGGEVEVRARHVVNATGVWVDRLMAMDDPARTVSVQPSKGVHLVVPTERVPLTGASILLPSRQGDGRSMFAIPWGRQTILGTTDTLYDGSLDAVSVTEADLDYVLAAANALFRLELGVDDVVGAWAGTRPLLRAKAGSTPSDMSRRHAVLTGRTGLVSVTGGKLTTYRRMAQDVVDLLVRRDGVDARCRTREIPLGATSAAVAADGARSVAPDLGDEALAVLVAQHGDRARDVAELMSDPALAAELSSAAPHTFADVVHAARHEGAATLDDVLSRRMRLALRARDAALPSALAAARLLAAEIGRDEAWALAQVGAYADAVRTERGAVPLDDSALTTPAAH